MSEHAVPPEPAMDLTAAGGTVAAVRDVVVRCPLELALELVRDIELLEPLERKAREVEVRPHDDTSGEYTIQGKLFDLVPWTGEFSYVQHGAGWHSEDLRPREDGWRVSGGFLVSRVDDQRTRITHYEDYTLPRRLRWWRPLIAWYMRRSQVGEMRDLAALLEREATRRAPATTG